MTRTETKKRHLLRRILVVLALLVVVALIAGPLIAAPFVRGAVVSALEESTGGTAEIDDLSFSLLGSAHVGGVRVVDRSGRPFAAVESVEARVDVLGALTGRIDLTLAVDGFRVELWQEEDGTWAAPSSERTGGAGPAGDTPGGADAPPPHEPAASEPVRAPDVRASVAVSNGTVVLHGRDGETTLDAITVTVDVEDLERPATIRSSLTVRGPGGPGAPTGRLSTDASVTLAHGGTLGPESVRGTASAHVEDVVLDAFAPLVAAALPVESLAGRLDGEARVELSGGLAISGDARFTLRDLVVDGPRETPPARVAEATLTAQATLAGDGTGEQSLLLELDRFARVAYTGTTAGLGTSQEAHLASDVELDVGAKGAAELALPWVELQEGLELGGRLKGALAIEADFHELEPRRASVRADAGFEQLTAARNGEDVPIGALTNATFGADAAVDLATGSLDLSRLALRVGAALEASGRASITGLPGLGAPDAALEVRDSSFELQGDLERLQRNLEGVLGPEALGPTLKGRLAATLTASGPANGPVRLQARAGLTDFSKNVVLEDGTRWRIEDPAPELTLDAAVDPATGSVELTRATIRSRAIEGELHGRFAEEAGGLGFALDGELSYVPDRIAAMLGPLVPGELTGSETEPITFRLTGTPASFEARDVLRACDGSATLGLGRFTTTGIELSGRVDLKIAQGVATLEGDVAANGGSLALDTRLGVAEAEELTLASSELRFGAKDVGANAAMSPLLANLHPAFASAKAVRDARLDGSITSSLELAYEGPLALETLAAGWEALPKQFIQGRGEFALRGATIRGMPLFDQLLEELGLDATQTLDIEPVGFRIRDGRVSYDQPWRWKIDDAETTFTGSIGLDETLDLQWSIPITKKLVAKQRLLEFLEGEVIAIPIRGTAKRPRVDWQGILGSLAEKAAQGGLEERLGIGGGDDGPAALLERANALWKEGEKAQAAELYRELRKSFRISLVYVLNRDRIDERAKYRDE